jgi:signal peptidase II
VSDARRARPRWLLLGAVGVGVLAFDQLSKWWAVNELADRTIELVWTLQFRLTFNKGIAFSMGGDRGQVFALVALVVVGIVLFTERNDPTKVGAVARGLVVGGAVGNLADRLFRAERGFLTGEVVDFVDVQWWPVFNVADAAVVIGCILLVIHLTFWDPGRHAGEGDGDEPAGDTATATTADATDAADVGR